MYVLSIYQRLYPKMPQGALESREGGLNILHSQLHLCLSQTDRQTHTDGQKDILLLLYIQDTYHCIPKVNILPVMDRHTHTHRHPVTFLYLGHLSLYSESEHPRLSWTRQPCAVSSFSGNIQGYQGIRQWTINCLHSQ